MSATASRTLDLRQHLPLVAILRGIRPEEVGAHARELVAAGITLIEVPTNSPEWLRSVAVALAETSGRAIVGAGTVLSIADVNVLAATGAALMVTPNTDEAVIRHAVARGLLCAIGFVTPSEAFAALAAGAQVLKLFPAAEMGPGYVCALKAVLPREVPLLAVGGITPDNLGEFLAAGCAGAGLGGDLYKPGQAPGVTRERALAFVDSYRKYMA